jgi:hypothetical protein
LIKRKFKTFKIFRLFKEDGNILKQFKTVNVQKFIEEFGLGGTNRVVGYTPDYVGFQPSKPVISKNFF